MLSKRWQQQWRGINDRVKISSSALLTTKRFIMETVKFKIGFALLGTLLLCACNNNQNQQSKEKDSTGSNSPTSDASKSEVAVNPLKECYFGDLHLHTSLSPDANMIGTTSLPEDSSSNKLKEVKIGDQTYVKVGETYYQPVQVDGKDKYEVTQVEQGEK
jgi:hypothetical protein